MTLESMTPESLLADLLARLDPAIYKQELHPTVTVTTPRCQCKHRPCVDCRRYIYVARTPQSKESRLPTYSTSQDFAERLAQKIRDSFNPTLRRLQVLEENALRETERKQVRIEDALAQWITVKQKDKCGRKLGGVYFTVQKQLNAFAAANGYTYVHQLDTPELTAWRNQWKSVKKSAIRVYQSRVINFFSFCVRMKMLDVNPAGGRLNPEGGLTKPDGKDRDQMVPLTKQQFDGVCDACWRYPVSIENGKDSPERLHALTLLLRWSGLAPIDAYRLRRDQLDADGVLTLARQKTGKSVVVKLPAAVAKELRAVPGTRKSHPDYFFWDGSTTKQTISTAIWRWYKKLWPLVQPQLELRTLKGELYQPHPYIFRCTFAVHFLAAGGDIHDLANLLGNTVAMCEQHYTPLVPGLKKAMLARQEATFAAQGAPELNEEETDEKFLRKAGVLPFKQRAAKAVS